MGSGSGRRVGLRSGPGATLDDELSLDGLRATIPASMKFHPRVLLGLLLALLTPGVAQAFPGLDWPSRGGGPAHRGATEEPPVPGPYVVDWEARLDGELVDEPRVHPSFVLAETRDRGGRHSLHVLDPDTGEALASPLVASGDQSMGATVGAGMVALRVGPKRVEWRVPAPGHWKSRAAILARERIGEPCFDRGSVWVAVDGQLERYAPGAADPDRVIEGDFGGPFAIEGDWMYALHRIRPGEWGLAEIDLIEGKRKHAAGLGSLDEGQLDSVRIVLDEGHVYVQGPLAIDFGLSAPATSMGSARPFPKDGRNQVSTNTTFWSTAPAISRNGWLTHAESPRLGATLMFRDPEARILILASEDEQGTLTKCRIPPLVQGDAAWLGGHLLRPMERTLDRRAAEPCVQRTVPLPRGVLLSLAGGRLRALEGALAQEHADARYAKRARSSELEGGFALLTDGRRIEGPLEWPSQRSPLRTAGGEQRFDLEDVLWIETEGGVPVFVAGERAAVRAAWEAAEFDLLAGAIRLLPEVRKTADPALIEGFIAEVQSHGFDESVELERALDLARRELESLRARPRTLDERRIAAFQLELEAWREEGLTSVLERADSLPSAASNHLRYALYRSLLDRSLLDRRPLDWRHDHPGTLAALRRLLPRDLAGSSELTARDALEFLVAREESPLVQVGRRSGTPESRKALESAKARWREDLVAFESEHLLLIAPAGIPAELARCLSLGELCCRAFHEELCPSLPALENAPRLEVHIFEHRDAYLAQSRGQGELGLAWTAGYYSVHERISRLYLKQEAHLSKDVLRTVVHELCHHWLHLACPALGGKTPVMDPELAGHWMVEGIATYMESLRFDTARRTWSGVEARASRLDILAGLPEGSAMDWSRVLGMTRETFDAVSTENDFPTPSAFFLTGRYHHSSEMARYYAQANGLTSFLMDGEGGRHREAFLEALFAYYRGEDPGIDLRRPFHKTPEALGQAVLAHARATVAEGE